MHPFTRDPRASVAALGEERLISQIRRWLGSASPRAPFGIGDDCAVLPASRGRQLITVDPVIFGGHFDATMPPAAVGEKLLKRNLSDLAAMGGRPTAAVLALTLDARVSLEWLERFYRGLARCARAYGVPIVGGDIAQAKGTLVASLTLLGEACRRRVLTRTGARPGDAIYVTGQLGGSLPTGHHLAFRPRLKEGAWLAARSEVCAMMDVSDGLAKDLHALTPAGAVPALKAESLPFRRGADLRAALTDGEDYELVFAVTAAAHRARFEAEWRRAFPRVPLTHLGEFAPASQVPAWAIDLASYRGFEHLRRSPARAHR